MPHAPHVVLLDLYAGGHHGQYIRQLVEYWGANTLPGRISVAVPPTFFDIHADVQALIERTDKVEAVPLDMPGWSITGSSSLVRNNQMHGRLLRRVVTTLRPDHVVLMYFDEIQLALAMGLRFAAPVTFSGIYFRPTFHYQRFGVQKIDWREHLRDWRKRVLLKTALRNPHLTHLLSLDPYAVPDIQVLGGGTQVVALPDGITPRPAQQTQAEVRAQWEVAKERKVALFFGSIDARKGIHEALAALLLLPPDVQKACCLVVIGRIHPLEKERVMEGVRRVRTETAVQVVVEDRFVEEEEIQGFVAAADLVLLLYQRHVGSSGVLVRAAQAGIPVLGSDYGLVGEHLRRRHLGLAVNTASPYAIAEGLVKGFSDQSTLPFDSEEARRFAEENTATLFAATIFQHAFKAAAG